jgi:hypothetical protein
MNLYIIVEGRRTEKKIYPVWIKYVNPTLRQISNLDEFTTDCYIIYSAQGIGDYEKVISQAIKDVNSHPEIDYLVISTDSEEISLEKRKSLLENFIINLNFDLTKVRLIIQHFCIEAWALGNKKAFKRNPSNKTLCNYYNFYNAMENDPEEMPNYNEDIFGSKAQFAFDYLTLALKEKYDHLRYEKGHPALIKKESYFKQLKERLENDNHIKSFQMFLDAFKN